jgi:PAS domain-containing protein
VAILGRARAKGDVAVSDGGPALVALLSERGELERATRAFMDWSDAHEGALAGCSDELGQLAAGQTDRLDARLDGCEAELVAVLDADGRRMSVLTIPAEPDGPEHEPASPLLDEPLDESPAIVWLKDLEGRYLRVNRRYLKQLDTDADGVCGRTDAELTPARSMEGMRLEEEGVTGREPLELEYLIGAFEERPAFVALRFALRDSDGQPTATCSVAAPVAEASLARSECERLMRIERWGRLDAFAIRQELLEEWGLTLADGTSGPPLDRDDRVAAALLERDEALAAAASLEQELQRERQQLLDLRTDSERAARRAEELGGAVAAEAARSEELEQSLGRAEARVGVLEAELQAVREELEERPLAVGAGEEDGPAPEGEGLRWGTELQRSLSGALVGLTEWRSVLNSAVGVLGSEGGWDATVAWCAEKPHGAMRCGGSWMRDPAGLAAFNTRTWKHVEDPATAEFGRARNRMATTCLLDLQSAEDPLLREAAAQGMGSALLVPVRDGGETIAMLELFSRSATAPDPELIVALEAVALQLAATAQLLRLADVPRWRTGRL